jgi:hypothetical protein
MKNIPFILFVSVLVLKQSFYAQNKTMDSLNLALKSAKEDNLKYADHGLLLTDKFLAI